MLGRTQLMRMCGGVRFKGQGNPGRSGVWLRDCRWLAVSGFADAVMRYLESPDTGKSQYKRNHDGSHVHPWQWALLRPALKVRVSTRMLCVRQHTP